MMVEPMLVISELRANSRESLRRCPSAKSSRVGSKMNSGGTWIACSSVLNEVSTSQPSGKNSSRVTTQAATERIERARALSVFMLLSASVQVLADDADQERGHDVGQDHREQRTGRSHPDVEVQERLLEDQVGEVGAGVARTA